MKSDALGRAGSNPVRSACLSFVIFGTFVCTAVSLLLSGPIPTSDGDCDEAFEVGASSCPYLFSMDWYLTQQHTPVISLYHEICRSPCLYSVSSSLKAELGFSRFVTDRHFLFPNVPLNMLEVSPPPSHASSLSKLPRSCAGNSSHKHCLKPAMTEWMTG